MFFLSPLAKDQPARPAEKMSIWAKMKAALQVAVCDSGFTVALCPAQERCPILTFLL